MKSSALTLLLVAALPGVTRAATTLVSPTLLNGGFETHAGGTTYAGDVSWFNYGAASQSTVLYNTGTKYAGTTGGIVSLASNPSESTGWTIDTGDVYNLSFYGNAATVSKLATTPIIWSLYYYSDDTGGGFNPGGDINSVTLFTGNVTDTTITANNTWTSVTTGDLDTATLDPSAISAAAGRTLYLRFYRTAGDSMFPVIDNVTLTANVVAVPEPSTCGLLGAVALAGIAGIRRRTRLR